MSIRFTVDQWRGGRLVIQDQDFGYDAALEVTGDFAEGQKHAYAEAVAEALNAAADTIPVATPNKGARK